MNDSLIDKINAKIAAGAYVPPSAFNIPGVGSAFPTPQGPLGSPGYEVPVGSGNPVSAAGDDEECSLGVFQSLFNPSIY
jgi:hypothetical protein